MQSRSVRLVAEAGPIDTNGQAMLPLAVENAGAGARQCRIYVTGLPAPWYNLRPRDLSLEAGESLPVRLAVHPPQAALGHYPFTVSARSDAGLETLAFTLMVKDGAIRIYPGPVTMQDRLAVRSMAAARPPVTAPPRRLPLWRLALAIPFLLLLLLVGVVVAKQSSGAPATETQLAGAPVGASAATRVAADALAATRIARVSGGHNRATAPGSPTSIAGVTPIAAPGTLRLSRAASASRTAPAGSSGAGPARPGPATPLTTRTPRGQAPMLPVSPASPAPQPAATTQPTATAQPTAASITPMAQPTRLSSPTATVPRPRPSPSLTATVSRPAGPRPAPAGVVQVTGARAATAPAARLGAASNPTPSRSRDAATRVHLVAAARAVRPAHHPAMPRQPRIVRGPAKHRLIARRRVTTRPAQRRPGPAAPGRRGALPHLWPSHRAPARRQPQSRPHPKVQRPASQPRNTGPHSGSTRRPPAHMPAGSTATRRESGLRVAWPAATLRFDRPNMLRLSTEPGAAIVVTLRAMIQVRGVGGRELAQPYHYTMYAVADRYGQATIPLRSAYVPTRPMHATLTVVARTAHGTTERSAPVMLMR